jgi:hypothetical protein
MGLRYQRRIGNSKGWGLNISGSGVSSSYRTKYGSISSKGFSIKSGIPGLTFRSGWGGGKDNGLFAFVFLVVMGAIFLFKISLLVLYNLARLVIYLTRLIIWGHIEFYHFGWRLYYYWKERQAKKLELQNEEPSKNMG